MNLVALTVPITLDKDGSARVGGTRVTLDTIMATFYEGASPEEIADWFPALRLADVYAVISYYLQYPSEVESYLSQRQKIADELRRENEARVDHRGLRERLLARRLSQ